MGDPYRQSVVEDEGQINTRVRKAFEEGFRGRRGTELGWKIAIGKSLGIDPDRVKITTPRPASLEIRIDGELSERDKTDVLPHVRVLIWESKPGWMDLAVVP
jgi:hypothetical protein